MQHLIQDMARMTIYTANEVMKWTQQSIKETGTVRELVSYCADRPLREQLQFVRY